MINTRSLRTRVLSMVMACSFVFALTSCNKQDPALKRKCESAVEDYMEFLKQGKNEKLKRYIDPKVDHFQQLGEEVEDYVFLVFQESIEYEIFEVKANEKEAEVKVNISVRSGKEVKDAFASSPKVDEIRNAVDKISASITQDIVIDLEYDKETKNYRICSSEEIFQMVDKQASKLYGFVDKNLESSDDDSGKKQATPTPAGITANNANFDELMEALVKFDVDYLSKNTNLSMGIYDPNMYSGFYQAEMKTLTYSSQLQQSSNVNRVSVMLHLEKKSGAAAMSKLMEDDDKLCPVLENYVCMLLKNDKGVSNIELKRHLEMNKLIPEFEALLDSAPTVKLDIPCAITQNSAGELYYEFDGDMSTVMPESDFFHYILNYPIEEHTDAFKKAAQSACNNGRISTGELDDCVRALSPAKYSMLEMNEILLKNDDFESVSYEDDPENALYFQSKDGAIIINIIKMEDLVAARNYVHMELYTATLDDTVKVKTEGTPFNMTITADVSGKLQCYGRLFAIQDTYYLFETFDSSTKSKEQMNDIIKDLGLPA